MSYSHEPCQPLVTVTGEANQDSKSPITQHKGLERKLVGNVTHRYSGSSHAATDRLPGAARERDGEVVVVSMLYRHSQCHSVPLMKNMSIQLLQITVGDYRKSVATHKNQLFSPFFLFEYRKQKS